MATEADRKEGMLWVMAHWLLPPEATREDAEALIQKAKERWQVGLDLKNSEVFWGLTALW